MMAPCSWKVLARCLLPFAFPAFLLLGAFPVHRWVYHSNRLEPGRRSTSWEPSTSSWN